MHVHPDLRTLADVDPLTAKLIDIEERRQREKIILIPSESFTQPAVREALGSAFTSIYAEGYPRRAMRRSTEGELSDIDAQLASHRRYADWRFYKGTELANLMESLAGRRAAMCFATPDIPAHQIFANVQPISGAAANLAVYEAFVNPGETVMGLDLTEGGHLTHGSQFNITGKRYNIVSYATDPATGKLDYDRIRQMAREFRPKMIIAGFTSYPWQPDWAQFRSIADEVGAILLADVAHVAGMIIGGVYPNPVGYADVIAFTTHKTLCGGRGAVILSTDPAIASRIDSSVFPGQQGGPHVNKFAAHAVAFKIAQSDAFRQLQHRIVENASALAAALVENGLTLAYGGTNTHLLLVDLRSLVTDTGFPVMGEIASRVLDLVGIVCNKNTIPGDRSAGDARGIRLGTPWATQRGMGPDEMSELARIIASVLKNIHPFEYIGLAGPLSRGKLPLDVLEEAREAVRALIARVDSHVSPRSERSLASGFAQEVGILRVHQGRASELLNEASTQDIEQLRIGETTRSLFFDDHAELIDEVTVGRLGDQDFLLLTHRDRVNRLQAWLRGLADGYVLFDPQDIFRKVQGPATVDRLRAEEVPDAYQGWLTLPLPELRRNQAAASVHKETPQAFDITKPYFIGQQMLELPTSDATRRDFTWEPKDQPLKRTPLYGAHVEAGARMVPFAGWEMPVWYQSALAEHHAVREHAGLYDLGHMGVFSVSGTSAAAFLNSVTSNYADWLRPGESQYAYLFAPDGSVLDDIFLYRRSTDRFLVVVNAANEDKDWEWLTGINKGRYLIDTQFPSRRPSGPVTLQNLKQDRDVMDMALQGPRSRQILELLLTDAQKALLGSLRRTEFCELDVERHQLLVARTGYTGEEIGYEIYVSGTDAVWLWERLLDIGSPLGLAPCGLASRDSTRTEAGLPLYGHELAGPYGISPFEAGFASYVKLHKPFFVGRDACVASYRRGARQIVRFEALSEANRPIHPGATVIDPNGSYVGRVTSCVVLERSQIGLALIDGKPTAIDPDSRLIVLNPQRRDEASKTSVELTAGDRVAIPLPVRVVSRFMQRAPITDGGAE
ncbi:glycine cleavage system aminomethyltransferase GcvT [Candidatus Bipolaricaulota bacterium]|nr:glycine cleavage system aminomethyltransferase GcvT [Candidatus Bipolaricaulota bacterium]